jgi:hypothetical protein
MNPELHGARGRTDGPDPDRAADGLPLLQAPRRLAFLLALLVLASGGLSLQLGQDLNFDLLNYHYYNGYAFLHGRTFTDLAPAGSQSYLPPLLHAFHYLGIAHLPPRLFGFLLGALQGLNLPLLLVLGLLVLPGGTARPASIALLAAIVGSLGPAAVSLLGTTFGDNLVAIPALLALVLLLGERPAADGARGAWTALVAGLLAGAATGLKLTMAAYHVGLIAAALLLWWRGGALVKRISWLALGSAIGYLATGGFWNLELWRRFGNPLFPLANAIFRSEYQSLENFRDARFDARSAYDLVRPFVDTALGRPERLMEIGMRDVRFLLLLLAGLGLVVILVVGRRRQRFPPFVDREKAFAAWWVTAYLAWALAFYTYRYAALLEFTAPLLLFVLLRRLFPARHALRAAAAAALLIVATTRVESWGRRPWQAPWLDLPIPALGLRPDSLILMVGQPSGFAAPSFRPDARFVHLTAVERFAAPAAWTPLVEAAVRDHQGPILLLSNFEFSRAECEARAEALGLATTPRCEPIRNGSLRFRLCELERR